MRIISILMLLLASALTSESALAGRYGHHGHASVHFGVFVGPPVFGPWWWWAPPPPVYYVPPIIYAPPVVYRQPAVVTAPTTTVVEPTPALPANRSSTQPQIGEQVSQAPRQMASEVSADFKQLYVYPRDGQSLQQQAQDEEKCNRWASAKTGAGTGAQQAASNFQRALAACLDAHGYSVK